MCGVDSHDGAAFKRFCSQYSQAVLIPDRDRRERATVLEFDKFEGAGFFEGEQGIAMHGRLSAAPVLSVRIAGSVTMPQESDRCRAGSR